MNESSNNASVNPGHPTVRGGLRALGRRLMKCALRAGLAGVVLIVLGWLALPFVPLPRALFEPPASSIELLDREGRPLRAVRTGESAFTQRAALAEIPQALVHATLAAEDGRFWQHPGVDGRAAARAAWSLVRHRRVVSGGSTITMQLIKLAEPRPRTFRSKLLEAVQALRLEQVWSKQRILEEYLNRLDYGNLSAGCAEAAEFYFGKPLRDLSVAECALLAGLPQAPTRLNPHAHFARAQQRQQWILERMRGRGFLATAEFDGARREPLRLASPRRQFQAPHFVDLVLQLGVPPAAEGRRTVPTTLDLELNRVVERTLVDQVARLRGHHAQNGAAVVIDNRSGDVLALVGSENYFAPQAGQVNGAWAPRSAGSTFKPFTYLLAFERGATPATVVADVPTEFATATGIFAPVNYNRRCHGPVRYRLALANSLNIAAVKVLASLGGADALQPRLQACGLTTLTQPAEHYGLGLTIGNAEARLLELANAYACLARLGEFKPFRLVRQSTGDAGRGEVARRVSDAGAAYLIADILGDNAARALAFGVDSSLRFDFPVACKTGTSSDFRDNWALGYTPEFTVGVWLGNFDGRPMERISGVTGAAPILHDIIEHLHERHGTSWYAPPANIVRAQIHAVTGKRKQHLTDAPTASGHVLVDEMFLAGALPPRESGADYDALGRVRLPAEYREWFASSDNPLAAQAVVDAASPVLRLIAPLPGTVFFLDPDLPESSRRIPLRAEGQGKLSWQSDSLECRADVSGALAILSEGRHRLTVQETATGARLETWIEVKSL